MKCSAFVFIFAFNVAVYAFAATPPELSISDKGLGPISSDTRFDQKEVQRLLPGLTVKRKVGMTEGEEFPTLVILNQKSALATINPSEDGNSIFSIRVANPRVINSLGPKIGMKYGGIYGDLVHKSCEAGMEEMSGAVICLDPKSKHIHYVFKGRHDGPDGELPNISALKNFTLREIVWKP
jgi:hypothetical protein